MRTIRTKELLSASNVILIDQLDRVNNAVQSYEEQVRYLNRVNDKNYKLGVFETYSKLIHEFEIKRATLARLKKRGRFIASIIKDRFDDTGILN